MEYYCQEIHEPCCTCGPLPLPHPSCQIPLQIGRSGQQLPCDSLDGSRACCHVETLPYEMIAAQPVTFPAFFVAEGALIAAENGSREERPPSFIFSTEATKGKRVRREATSSHSPSTGSAGSGGGATAAEGHVIHGLDSTARTISSVAPYWVPDEIKRYFRNCGSKSRGRSLHRRCSHKARRSAGCKHKNVLPESPPSRIMPRHILLALLAVAVTLLLVGVCADVYAMLWQGRGSRPPPHPPLEPFQKSGDVVPMLSGQPYSNDEDSRWVKEELLEYPARPAQRRIENTVYFPSHRTESSVEETNEEISASTIDTETKQGEVMGQRDGADNADHSKGAALNKTRRQSPCDAFTFTYCHSPRNEFFYKRSINACVAVATDTVGLCIVGRNRFASKSSCRQACVDGTSRADRCLNNAVFRRCETQDVTGLWWHFDGHSCLRWNLPSGLCPSYHSDVFSSQRDCWTNCEAKPRKRLCRAATPDVCYSAHLRFPYFAVGGPRVRCLKVSSISYGGRRCLAGSNRFPTVQACQEACMSNTHFD
ncbi:uncharacterized protein [Dermacentor albipictus]|uniref:uncharacterized protein n=1 Tax=Dermacentor albipictus TaxID=60249 RepID=UPI0038FCA852